MNQIGEYRYLCGDVTLESFLEAGPAGYLLHYNALGTLNPRGGTAPGETMYRLAQTEDLAKPAQAADSRDEAYTVFPVMSRADPGKTRFLVGCTERCDIEINEASVSREHAWIEVKGGQCLLRDNGSTAGSLVNDNALASGEDWPLISGSRVTLGTVTLQFLAPTEFYNFVRRFLA